MLIIKRIHVGGKQGGQRLSSELLLWDFIEDGFRKGDFLFPPLMAIMNVFFIKTSVGFKYFLRVLMDRLCTFLVNFSTVTFHFGSDES